MLLSELKKTKLPDAPGVYLFKQGRTILYIGKAASLRDRVRSYFSSDLSEARSPAVAGMVGKATKVSFQETASVLEALILEANLIKRHQPPYNVEQKDNKSWNYIVVTKEEYPRVLVVRGREMATNWREKEISRVFGPYPHGGQLREAYRIVRKIFPFRDTCTPETGRPCFNAQIGLCPGVCSGETSKREHAQTVRHVCQLFGGNFKGLRRQLARDMKAAAKAEEYERATRLRAQLAALEHVRDVSLIKGGLRNALGGPTAARATVRIEAFDVAHTAGSETVAVMTVVEGGEPEKSAYRKFRIRSVKNDDVGALCEALERRLAHPEWPLPRVFAIDGGKAQVRATENLLKRVGIGIPVVGIVKDEFHRPKGLIGNAKAIEQYGKEILLANAEAHRFAISWHRKRRGKAMRDGS